MPNEVKLEPCPWCEGMSIKTLVPRGPRVHEYVICLDCQNGVVSDDGIAAWNALPRGPIEGDCIHCGRAVTNDDAGHWKDCPSHPANAEIARLRAALQKAVDDYGKPGGPWNVPREPGTWLQMATDALGKK